MPLHFVVDDDATLSRTASSLAESAETALRSSVGDARVDDEIAISGAEAHHAAVVRRVRVGEEVTLGDGRGLWLTGEVTDVQPKRVVVRVLSRADADAPTPRLVLVQALAKGDRDELAVQAATELGVDEIVPWQAERSVSRWDAAKARKGRARWQSIVREAAKQAHRAWVPDVAELTTTTDLARRCADARVVVLEPGAPHPLTGLELGDGRDVVLVVGPEGGVSPSELDRLVDAGAEAARLGTTVLRTSTAGPAALAVVSAALGRW